MVNRGRYYYELARRGSLESDNPGLAQIKKFSSKAKRVIDVGCGEGSRLNSFLGRRRGVGIDINKYAISQARKQYPHHKFIQYIGEKFPIPDNQFDFSYSAFVLEHTDNPENFLREIIRITKPGGSIAIICPYYGAPNRRSPVSLQNPLSKLLKGSVGDLFPSNRLNYTKVTPKEIYRESDDDTTCEPYLLTLVKYLEQNKIKIKELSSLWEIDDNAHSPHQRLFRSLGQKNIYPFKYWGPQLFIVFTKK